MDRGGAESPIHEADFCARVAGFTKAIADANAPLHFSEARIEGYGSGAQRRRRKDLRFYDRQGKLVLCGEVKLPGTLEGRSPYDDNLVRDAHEKADNADLRYFFTWNVNAFVLWDRQLWNVPLLERRVREWRLGRNLASPEDAARPDVLELIEKKFLPGLLAELSDILTGKRAEWAMPPDDLFIRILESHLDWPVALTSNWLGREADRDRAFNSRLEEWMTSRDWTFVRKPPEEWWKALDRAARSLAYIWANRLIFYKVLRDRFPDLPRLELKPTVRTPAAANHVLLYLFEQAVRRSGDYEPLLFPYAKDWASQHVFEPPNALDAWRGLLRAIEAVDFQSISADVVGHIFQRLISPEERHQYGQHFTGADAVDLINSFCIRKADDKVLDPACGSGSFLVRAYYRKKTLDPLKPHRELIAELFGADIDLYPAHLATLNLAAREINEEANYPRIARRNFFGVSPDEPFVEIPDGRGGVASLPLPTLDAVVGNPPYVRQEKIDKKEKSSLVKTVDSAWFGLSLSGRSDYHCYFWPVATRFLREDGYFGFLTSSSWLDVEYGFDLQRWILQNFQILAIMESAAEPWFPDARVKTCITILKGCQDEAARMSHLVKFVQFRKPLAEIIGVQAGEDERARQRAVDGLRSRIEEATGGHSDEQLRIIAKLQGDLWKDGVRAGRILGQAPIVEAAGDDEDEANSNGAQANGNGAAEVRETAPLYGPSMEGGHGRSGGGPDNPDTAPGREDYRAGKWGRYLRAPDFYFEIMREFGSKFVPLGDLVEIRRGITSGCDAFFMPHDVTKECLKAWPDPKLFKREANGADRKEVEDGRLKIIKAGDGSVHPIETEYLAPEVHGPMEVDQPMVRKGALPRVILLVSRRPSDLRGSWVWRYLRYGETQPFASKKSKAVPVAKRSSCAGRDPWYDLTKLVNPGFALWPMTHKYRHIIPANPDKVISNKRYFDLSNKELSALEQNVLLGILNSTFTGLFKAFYGRYAGTEVTLDTEVTDVNMLEVPDPRGIPRQLGARFQAAFKQMTKRPTGHFLEETLQECTSVERAKRIAEGPMGLPVELQESNRRELDDAVLELLGIKDAARRRELRDRLYQETAHYFRVGRVVELQANENKKLGKARRFSADELAADVWDAAELPDLTPLVEWLAMQPGRDALVNIPAELPAVAAPAASAQMFDAETVYFGKGRKQHLVCTCHAQAALIARLANLGLHGELELPSRERDGRTLLVAVDARLAAARARFKELAAKRTGDEDRQEELVGLLIHWLVHGKPKRS